MGIKITVKGADYSQWFGGNVDVDQLYSDFLDRFASAGGTLSDTHKTALKKMLESMSNEIGYIDDMFLFLGTTAQTQSLNIMNDGTLAFGGTNSQYTNLGFNSNGTAFANTKWKPSGNFSVGVFAAPITYTNDSAAFCGVLDTGRLILSAKGNASVLYGVQLRDGKVDATIRAATRPTNTAKYMCSADDGATLSLYSSEELAPLRVSHAEIDYSKISNNVYIGGYANSGLKEPINTTFKAFFRGRYLDETKMTKVITVINTFLSDIGR